ncbi:MAG: hypothetical protein A3G21_11110 [Acidobacteria bacterium RIFCSPLOWO2_12_FULL_66_21]|nr:MAG: hypothetical protein A3G21_11110 [Acidobacteria bacterium RIFCSPLOWO2_12_FULL_66_21]
MSDTSRSHRDHWLPALAGFLVLAVVWTWPLLPHVASRIPSDLGDPVLNTWILWWNAHAVPFTDRWWSPPFFHPMRGALALSEHLAGLGVITTPVQLAGGSALLAYNVAMILSYALCGFFAFALVRHLTGSTVAGVCGGVAYACAPYRAGQLSHLQVLTSQWMPLALLALHQYLASRRARWLFVFAAAWIVQALSNGYYLLFFPVLVGLWLAWFVRWRRDARAGAAIIAAWAGASLLLAPVLMKYVAVHASLGLERSPEEIRRYSAVLSSFVRPPRMLAFWTAPDISMAESYLFPGITAVLLVCASAVAAWRGSIRDAFRSRSPLLFYGAATVLFWLLTLGPAPPGHWPQALLHPYSLLMALPGFNGLRVPPRFAMLAALTLAVAAGIAVARLAPPRGRWRAIVFAAVFAGLARDGWMKPMPLVTPPGRLSLDVPREAALLVLPVDDTESSAAAMYSTMTHGHPLINGYSGYFPAHYQILGTALARGDRSVLERLAQSGPIAVVVNTRSGGHPELIALVEGVPGVVRSGVTGAGRTYLLPARPRTREAETGEVYPARVEEQPQEHALFDLGSERIVRLVEFPLRWHYPELGERLAIEVSTDGRAWSTAWEDWTGAAALSAALRDERDVPVRLTIRDVPARYVRVHPAPPWLYRELTISGPR